MMLSIKWNKRENHMIVSSEKEKFSVRVSCVVRSEINHWRPNKKKDPKKEVVYMITKNNKEFKIPVMPRGFPVGKWRIKEIQARNNPYQRPFFISTDAWQVLDVWALDSYGGYDHKTPQKIRDYMYGIHLSKSNTTLGCIKVCDEIEFNKLLDLVFEELGKDREPLLEVVDE